MTTGSGTLFGEELTKEQLMEEHKKEEVLRLNEKSARVRILYKMLGDNVSGELLSYIDKNGFFTAPASAKYHGVHEGGLFDHSYFVTKYLVELTENMNVQWQNPRSPYVVGMFHDLCKIDNYYREQIGEAKDANGTVLYKCFSPHWEYTTDRLLEGHGDKSVMILSTLMQLTEEEMLCIRYHMGAYNKDDWAGYDRAIKKYPTVLLTHTADMYASKVSEHKLELEELEEICRRR